MLVHRTLEPSAELPTREILKNRAFLADVALNHFGKFEHRLLLVPGMTIRTGKTALNVRKHMRLLADSLRWMWFVFVF
jgi:hypothetical protein